MRDRSETLKLPTQPTEYLTAKPPNFTSYQYLSTRKLTENPAYYVIFRHNTLNSCCEFIYSIHFYLMNYLNKLNTSPSAGSGFVVSEYFSFEESPNSSTTRAFIEILLHTTLTLPLR